MITMGINLGIFVALYVLGAFMSFRYLCHSVMNDYGLGCILTLGFIVIGAHVIAFMPVQYAVWGACAYSMAGFAYAAGLER